MQRVARWRRNIAWKDRIWQFTILKMVSAKEKPCCVWRMRIKKYAEVFYQNSSSCQLLHDSFRAGEFREYIGFLLNHQPVCRIDCILLPNFWIISLQRKIPALTKQKLRQLINFSVLSLKNKISKWFSVRKSKWKLFIDYWFLDNCWKFWSSFMSNGSGI